MGVRSRSRVVFDILIIVLSTNSPTVEAPTTPRARAHGAHRSQFHRSRENTSPRVACGALTAARRSLTRHARLLTESDSETRESRLWSVVRATAQTVHTRTTHMCAGLLPHLSLQLHFVFEAGGVRVSSLRGHSPRTPGTPGSRRCAVEADSCGRAQGVFAGPHA